MLEYLPEGPWEVSKVLLLEVGCTLITPKVEGSKQCILGKGSQEELLVVVGARGDACYEGIGKQKRERRKHCSIAVLLR